MGCYGIGTGPLMAEVIEQSRDERGIIWPPSITPYDIDLIALGTSPEIAETAESLYEDLHAKGCEILYDDRDESAGVKFNDADLMGVPLRLTVSSRTLEAGGVEVKLRHEKGHQIVPLEDLESTIYWLLS